MDRLRYLERKRTIAMISAISVFIAVAVWGCGDPSMDSPQTSDHRPASASFAIRWHPYPEDQTLQNMASQNTLADQCPDNGVQWVQCKVYGDVGDGKEEEITSHRWPCADRQGEINGIRPGSNRRFVILGLNADDEIIYRGQTMDGIDVKPGQFVDAGYIEAYPFVPRLLTPDDESQADVGNLQLTWDEVKGASVYHIIVSQHSDLTDPIIDIPTNNAAYELSGLSQDTPHYWRVLAGDGLGNKGRASNIRSFSLIIFTGPLPDTGQTHSFTDTYGEDADYNINPPVYKKLDKNGVSLEASAQAWTMVEDDVTKLVWEVKTKDGGIHDMGKTFYWQDIQDEFIGKLNQEEFGGRSDWRLPSIKELATLINFATTDPAINAFFPNTESDEYWSSTAKAGVDEASWTVDFTKGEFAGLFENRLDERLRVRAVSGDPNGYGVKNQMLKNDDYTVTDLRTKLIWRYVSGFTYNFEYTWENAIQYCQDSNHASYEDWRLPNIRELLSIVDFKRADNVIETALRSNITTSGLNGFWSSTKTIARDSTELLWGMDNDTGQTMDIANSSGVQPNNVICVRSGEE